MTKGVEDGMEDERTCECGHGRGCHWLRYIDEAGCYRPKECASKDCSCQQFKPGPRQATPFIRSAPATTEVRGKASPEKPAMPFMAPTVTTLRGDLAVYLDLEFGGHFETRHINAIMKIIEWRYPDAESHESSKRGELWKLD